MQQEKQDLLQEELGIKNNRKKYVFILGAAVLLVAAGILVWVFVFGQSSGSGSELSAQQYMEETVMQGNIVVGLSEAGSVNMDDMAVSLGFDVTVEETFVAAGSYVSEGDALLKIELEDYTALYEEKAAALSSAQLQLTQAQADAAVKRSDAQYNYDTAVQNGNNAAGIYSLQLSELENGYITLQNEVAALETQKASIERQLTNGLDNDYGFATYQSELAAIDAQILDIEAQIRAAQPQDVDALNATLAQLATQRAEKVEQRTQAQADYDKAFLEMQTQLTTVSNSLTQKYTERDNYLADMPMQRINYEQQYNATMHTFETAQSVYTSAIAQVETSLEQAQQAVDTAQDVMDDFEQMPSDGIITAPHDGYVMNMSAQDATVAANTALVTLADNTFVYLAVSIPQEDIADISVGMQANVLLDAYDDTSLPAMVDSISVTPSGNMQSSVNYTVVVSCSLSDYLDMVVYEGMSAEVTFVQKQVEDVLVVSNKCITSEDGQQTVQRLNDDGSIEQVVVQTGFSDGFDVEITSGLNAGDIVLIENVVASNENR